MPSDARLGRRVLDRPKVVEPHRDLPHVGAADQPGAPTGRSVAKGDHRVLVTTSTLLGIAAQAIREAFAGCSRT